MKNILIGIIAIFPLLANAGIVEIRDVPTTWKLENYTGNGLVAWLTGSSCKNGKVSFGSTATDDNKKRFWSSIMAAKISEQKVFVKYDNTTSGCTIMSFGHPQE